MEFNATFFFGLLSTIAALISMQFKDMRLVMIFQIICNGTGAVSYILSGGSSGCGIYLIAIIQSLVYFVFRSRGKEAPNLLAVAFALGYIICSAFTYKVPLDIVPAVAALACAFGIAQKNPSRYRLLLLANGIIWLIYDLILPAAITMTLSHVVTIASALIGIIRLDLRRKN